MFYCPGCKITCPGEPQTAGKCAVCSNLALPVAETDYDEARSMALFGTSVRFADKAVELDFTDATADDEIDREPAWSDTPDGLSPLPMKAAGSFFRAIKDGTMRPSNASDGDGGIPIPPEIQSAVVRELKICETMEAECEKKGLDIDALDPVQWRAMRQRIDNELVADAPTIHRDYAKTCAETMVAIDKLIDDWSNEPPAAACPPQPTAVVSMDMAGETLADATVLVSNQVRDRIVADRAFTEYGGRMARLHEALGRPIPGFAFTPLVEMSPEQVAEVRAAWAKCYSGTGNIISLPASIEYRYDRIADAKPRPRHAGSGMKTLCIANELLDDPAVSNAYTMLVTAISDAQARNRQAVGDCSFDQSPTGREQNETVGAPSNDQAPTAYVAEYRERKTAVDGRVCYPVNCRAEQGNGFASSAVGELLFVCDAHPALLVNFDDQSGDHCGYIDHSGAIADIRKRGVTRLRVESVSEISGVAQAYAVDESGNELLREPTYPLNATQQNERLERLKKALTGKPPGGYATDVEAVAASKLPSVPAAARMHAKWEPESVRCVRCGHRKEEHNLGCFGTWCNYKPVGG